MTEIEPKGAGICRAVSTACALAAAAAGLVALAGWALHIEALESIVPGTVAMKANTALGLLSAGLSAALYNLAPAGGPGRRLAQGLAAFTCALGLASLGEDAFGLDLGIDQFLFTEPAGAIATAHLGRMAPVTAMNFVLAGLALMLLELDFAWLSQVLALAVGLAGLAAFAGYAYGLAGLTALLPFLSYTKMAVNTALAFMALSLGLVLLRPGRGFLAFCSAPGDRAAGLLVIAAAGLLLPAAGHMLVNLFLGQAAWVQAPFHSAVETMNSVSALLLAWLIFWLAGKGELPDDYAFVPPALVAIGLLNGLHACLNPGDAYVLLHTASLVLGGFLFALTWVAGRAKPLSHRHFLAFSGGVLALGSILVFSAGSLPDLLHGGEFSGLARGLNMAGGLFFLAGAARFSLNYRRSRKMEDQLFSIFCFLKAWAGFLFYSTSIYSMDWWYWHLLRLAAHSLLVFYLFVAFRRMAARERDAEIARRAAEEGSRAKSEFLSNMSHEFRTPLNSIIGFSEALEDRLFGPLNDKQGQYVGYVLGSSRHLLALINDILDLSKVEAGKMDYEPEKTGLKELLEGANSMFQAKAMEKNLTLALEFTAAEGLALEADTRKLKQVMFNLLSNALKFTPEGGRVTVRAAGDGNGGAVISVADTGPGIKPEDIQKLFREFSQLESGYTKTYEGTGLGLALTRRLVEMHGGEIKAESPGLGRGATFTFTLPGRSKGKYGA